MVGKIARKLKLEPPWCSRRCAMPLPVSVYEVNAHRTFCVTIVAWLLELNTGGCWKYTVYIPYDGLLFYASSTLKARTRDFSNHSNSSAWEHRYHTTELKAVYSHCYHICMRLREGDLSTFYCLTFLVSLHLHNELIASFFWLHVQYFLTRVWAFPPLSCPVMGLTIRLQQLGISTSGTNQGSINRRLNYTITSCCVGSPHLNIIWVAAASAEEYNISWVSIEDGAALMIRTGRCWSILALSQL